MGRWIKHEGCLNCGSRDNVGVYDDGSKFCFGCHWYTRPEGTDRLKEFAASRLLNAYEHHERGIGINLPTDYTLDIPGAHLVWLHQYLNQWEILDHKIGYSPQYNRIIFPIYDRAMKLLLWTGRAGEGLTPKYLTMGKRNEALDVVSSNVLSDRVVVVEDRVSAIRTSAVCSSVALFGSVMPLEWAVTLSKAFSGVVLWLDSDKRSEALKQALKLSPFFRHGVKVVFSKEDPKCYNDQEISKHLGSA